MRRTKATILAALEKAGAAGDRGRRFLQRAAPPCRDNYGLCRSPSSRSRVSPATTASESRRPSSLAARAPAIPVRRGSRLDPRGTVRVLMTGPDGFE